MSSGVAGQEGPWRFSGIFIRFMYARTSGIVTSAASTRRGTHAGRVASMHEMSITQSVVEICERSSAGRKITSVTLEIGGLSGVVPDAIRILF